VALKAGNPLLRVPHSCGQMAWKLGKTINRGGQEIYPYFCAACGKKIALYESKNDVMQHGLAFVVLSLPTDANVCQRCGHYGAELHHWAPSAIFGDADKWPTGYLCQPCHSRWHNEMNKHCSN